MDTDSKLKIITAIVTLGWTALRGLPKLIKGIRRFSAGVDAIEQVNAQFQNNGGSTIKDTLDRLESNQLIERERNRAVSTLLPAGMFEFDGDGECIWVSSRYTEITGANLESACGWNWTTNINPKDRTRVIAEWSQAVAQERRMIISYRLDTAMGARHLLVETFPVHKNDKCIAHIGLVCQLSAE